MSRKHMTRKHARALSPTQQMTRWLAPAALAAALGVTALTAAPPARAQDDLVRVLVDVADVIFRSGAPYYRHGGYDDRLVLVRDRDGHARYYRYLPRGHGGHGDRDVKCNKHGKCKIKYSYYDPRYDRDRYRRHARHDRDRDDRDWDDDDWDDDDDRRWSRVRYWRGDRDDD